MLRRAVLLTIASATLAVPSAAHARGADLLTRSALHITGARTDDLAGAATSAVGDVNGDGIRDVAVASLASTSAAMPAAGRVWIVFGRSRTASVDLAHLGRGGIAIVDPHGADRFGEAVAPAGDVNGDGLADVAIGAPGATYAGRHDAGTVTIVFGRRSAARIRTDRLGHAGAVIGGFRGDDGIDTGTRLGGSIAPVGDMDGDGRGDLAIGPAASGGQAFPTIFVVHGGRIGAGLDLASLGDRGLSIAEDSYAYGTQTAAVSAVGDVNGDGLADLGITQRQPGPSATTAPTAWILFGRRGGGRVHLGYLNGAGFAITAPDPREVGGALVGVGDVTGDGLSELALGAPGLDHGAGGVYLLPGHAGPATINLGAPPPGTRLLTGSQLDQPKLPGSRAGSTLAVVRLRGVDGPVLAVGSPLASPHGLRQAGLIDLIAVKDVRRDGLAGAASLLRLEGSRAGAEAGHALAADPSIAAGLVTGSWLADAPGRDAAGSVDDLRLDAAPLRPPSRTRGSGPRLLGSGTGTGTMVLADGSRWAVLAGQDARSVVLDTAHGDRTRDLQLSAGCAVHDVRRGEALVSCTPDIGLSAYGTPAQPFVVNLASGRMTKVAINDPVDPSAGWASLGRYWIEGPAGCYHCTVNYLDRRTGKVRRGPSDIDDPGPERNLDSPTLRPLAAGDPGPDLREGAYRVRLPASPERHALVLLHGRRHVTLSRCRGGCSSVRLGGGRVTWVEGRAVRLYTTSTHRRRSWRIPLPARGTDIDDVAAGLFVRTVGPVAVAATHTRHAIFVTTSGYVPGATTEQRLFEIRL